MIINLISNTNTNIVLNMPTESYFLYSNCSYIYTWPFSTNSVKMEYAVSFDTGWLIYLVDMKKTNTVHIIH